MNKFLLSIRNYLFISIFTWYFVLLSNCAGKKKIIQKEESEFIKELRDKINKRTIGFDDIFEKDYGEFNDKNETNEITLMNLIENFRSKNVNSNTYNGDINVDYLLLKNEEKFVDIMLNKDNLKYNIYGKDGKHWYKNDIKSKAPLNFFQQLVVSSASWQTLQYLSFKIVEKIINSNEKYDINFGILWCVYAKEDNLDKALNLLNDFIKKCENKVKNGQKLSKHEVNVLYETLEMEKFDDIITDSLPEYLVKVSFGFKMRSQFKKTKEILKKNALLL